MRFSARRLGELQRQLPLSSHDCHLCITETGQVVFGVHPGSTETVSSPKTYTDGACHYATATLSDAGMVLYVDGAQVAADSTVTTAQSYTGYWRLGYDSLSGWTGIGTSLYFNGSLRYAAEYTSALTAAQIADHWGAGIGT